LPSGHVYYQVLQGTCRDAIAGGVRNWTYGFFTGLRRIGYPLTIRCDSLTSVDPPTVRCLIQRLADSVRSVPPYVPVYLGVCPLIRAQDMCPVYLGVCPCIRAPYVPVYLGVCPRICARLLGLSFVRICGGLLTQRVCPTRPLCCGYPLVCAGFVSPYGSVWGVMICLVMLVGARACPVCNGCAPGAL
jgi:hypothetical protein